MNPFSDARCADQLVLKTISMSIAIALKSCEQIDGRELYDQLSQVHQIVKVRYEGLAFGRLNSLPHAFKYNRA